jgi:hypothetical protein
VCTTDRVSMRWHSVLYPIISILQTSNCLRISARFCLMAGAVRASRPNCDNAYVSSSSRFELGWFSAGARGRWHTATGRTAWGVTAWHTAACIVE